AYMPGHPEPGQVHPCTGGILLVAASEQPAGSVRPGVLLDRDIPTDREVFWRYFQEGILPLLQVAMDGRIADGGEPPVAFWEEAAFDVRIPETDEHLGIGEERVAPLEALHEDIYFGLLEHFRLFAERTGLPADSQFGRILPRVSTAAPAGRPSVVFTARPFAGRAAPGRPTPGAAAGVAAIGLAAGRLEFAIEAGDRAAEVCRAARAGGLDVRLDARTGCCLLRTPRPRQTAAERPAAGRTPAPPLDRRLPMREVERWVERLGRLPHLVAWQAGTSFQGRGIRVLEAVLAGGGRLVSVARTRLLKPTLLLNARHHANEVSSTSAALRLAWELAATPRGRAALKRVNVAIVPLENADGVATLEELLPGCEGHKLHAARYNALGVEWYADYFLERPRFPEALVKPLLWRRWLPLLVLDAHGVPSHEWDQPFSGYAPGRFRAYWIPRAFVYAILPFIEDPSHPGHRAARAIARVLGRALGAERDIGRLDREIKARYRRYARSWEPTVFPPSAAGRLTVLPSDRRLTGLNFGVQRWPVTISEIVTEVTDEVVDGRLLGLCARAHLTAAWGLLAWLGKQSPGRLVRRPSTRGILLSWEAQR
ncbi:MAG TPA: M14 family metallopeptidase, partial [Desulfobacterales bacterium]|nr:M14 family metallopeptidase [Desulfobacterales bacterium]